MISRDRFIRAIRPDYKLLAGKFVCRVCGWMGAMASKQDQFERMQLEELLHHACPSTVDRSRLHISARNSPMILTDGVFGLSKTDRANLRRRHRSRSQAPT
jgi:hypothetical protein